MESEIDRHTKRDQEMSRPPREKEGSSEGCAGEGWYRAEMQGGGACGGRVG
jgi:hypothetical protein